MINMPSEYALMKDKEIIKKIEKIKSSYDNTLIILAHHYQNDLIVNIADFIGDSFGLAKIASEQKSAQRVVFCGVNFMAEAARILAGEHQTVFLPNHDAGCPLSDFAKRVDVDRAWNDLGSIMDTSKIIPLCYMNSSSEIKAFCGKHGGAVCTSSNAVNIFKWAFEKGNKILFLPDEQLGRNTAKKLNKDKLAVWNPSYKFGGNTETELKNAEIILWKGYCHVHAFWFSIDDIKNLREQNPDIKIIVHPECTPEVVDAADENGSTAYIIDYVEKAPKKSIIAVGTEINLVKRLHDKYKDEKTIIPLKRSLCPNMMKISPAHLLFCLENMNTDEFVVHVNEDVIDNAKKALDRMLEIG